MLFKRFFLTFIFTILIFGISLSLSFPGIINESHAQEIEVGNISLSTGSNVEVGDSITFSVATKGDTSNATFNWSFGDGTIVEETSPTHSYKEAGNFVVRVQVRSGDFNSIATTQILVRNKRVGDIISSVSSSSIVLDSKRNIWTANIDNDTVSRINSDSKNFIAEYQVCKKPSSISSGNNNNIWVTCRNDDSVVMLDAQSGVVTKRISLPWGSAPAGIVTNPNTGVSFVAAEGSNTVFKLSSDGIITSTLNGIFKPRALVLNLKSEVLYVASFLSDKSAGNVYKIATKNNLSKAKTIKLNADTTTEDNNIRARGVPNYLLSISINGSTGNILVGGKKDNIFRGQNRDGNALTFETSVRPIVSIIDSNTEKELFDERIDADNQPPVSALTHTPDGTFLFVVHRGTNSLIVYNTDTNRELLTISVGLAPEGIVYDPETKTLFTKNLTDRTVTSVDISDLVTSGKESIGEKKQIKVVQNEKFKPEVLLGKQVFYNAQDTKMAKDGYISCATCHLDGDHDGMTWDFTDRGEGLRNTTALRGTQGDISGFLHWTGNFDEVQDFEHDITGSFGGSGFLNGNDIGTPLGKPKAGLSKELDAMAEYLRSLDRFERSNFRNPDGSFTEDARKGARVFLDMNCQSCHNGDFLSDSISGVRHDVGTAINSSGLRLGSNLDGFDTPTLYGLAQSAPYLHDGRFNTLEELFKSRDAGSIHDLSSKLDDTSIRQLSRFLYELDTIKTDIEALAKSGDNNPSPDPKPSPKPEPSPAPDENSSDFEIFINAGSSKNYTDDEGNVWRADTFSSSGSNKLVAVEKLPRLNRNFRKYKNIFETTRLNTTGYEFNVPNGNYLVELFTAEFDNAAVEGDRIFTLGLEEIESSEIDVYKFQKVSSRRSKLGVLIAEYVSVTDGQLNIDINRKVGDTIISGIHIVSPSAWVKGQSNRRAQRMLKRATRDLTRAEKRKERGRIKQYEIENYEERLKLAKEAIKYIKPEESRRNRRRRRAKAKLYPSQIKKS